jgi:rubrerythrin
MGLSKKLKDALTDVYELGARPPKPNRFDFTSGRWFCPKCAVHLEQAASGKYECPTCNRTIGEFVYELVEFHPHLEK